MSRHRPKPTDATAPPDVRVLVLTTRWNRHVVDRIAEGIRAVLPDARCRDVPGAYELPTAAKWAAMSGDYDAIIAVGCVIRGETPHFEYVAGNCARGLMDASLQTGVPCIFGVLTVETEQQALDRSGGAHGDAGGEAARAALEMIALRRDLTADVSPLRSPARD